MKKLLPWFILACIMAAACRVGAVPDTDKGGGGHPCGAGGGNQVTKNPSCAPATPQPTSPGGPPNGTVGQAGSGIMLISCTYQSNLCVHRPFIWVNDKSGNSESGSAAASLAQMNLRVDIGEEASAFSMASSAHCRANFDNDAYASVNECKWWHYFEFMAIHSNQQDGFFPAQGSFSPAPVPTIAGSGFGGFPGGGFNTGVCGSTGSSLTKIGDKALTQPGVSESMFQHGLTFSDAPHRLFYTVDNCSNPGPSTYLMTVDNSTYENIVQSYISGTVVGAINMGTDSTYDKIAGFESDISNPNIAAIGACNGQQPCGYIINPSAPTNEYASNTGWVNAHNNLFTSLHHVGTFNGIVLPMQITFNGCMSGLNTSNTLELEDHLFDSANVIGCEFEQPLHGFGNNNFGLQPQSWTSVDNSISRIQSDHPNVFTNLNNSEAPDGLFASCSLNPAGGCPHGEFRILEVAFWLWTTKGGNAHMLIKHDEDLNTSIQGQVLQDYQEDQFAVAPGDGFPTTAPYFPTNCPSLNCNATTGWDPTAHADGNGGSGTDVNDRAADHGAVDTICPGSTALGLVDWKGNPVGTYCKEYDNIYYPDINLAYQTVASIFGLASNYVAIVINPSTSTYTPTAADFPRHGSTGYDAQLVFSNLTAGAQAVLSCSGSCLSYPQPGSNNWVAGGNNMSIVKNFTLGATSVCSQCAVVLFHHG